MWRWAAVRVFAPSALRRRGFTVLHTTRCVIDAGAVFKAKATVRVDAPAIE